MAERRMFAKTIIDSDAFLDMPLSTQALYFHLSMRADDDGFINNPKKIQRMIGASDDDLKVLVAKRFIIPFESGIVVIKHWKIHNYIQKDRYKPTVYAEEKKLIDVKGNGAYTDKISSDNQVDTLCIQNDNQMDTQYRIGKDSIGKDRLDEDSIGEEEAEETPSKPTRHKYGFYKNVLLSDEDYQKLQAEFPHDYSERIERLSEYIASTGKSYKSHLATIRMWAKKDQPNASTQRSIPQASSSNPFLELAMRQRGEQ